MSTGILMGYYGEQFIMHTQGGWGSLVVSHYGAVRLFASWHNGHYAIILKYAANRLFIKINFFSKIFNKFVCIFEKRCYIICRDKEKGMISE